MTRSSYRSLGPSLLVGAAILASSFIAVRSTQTGWPALTAPLILALAFISADLWNSRLRGRFSGPTPSAFILAGSFLLASWIVGPAMVKNLIPILGAAGWVALQRRPQNRTNICSGI